MQYARALLRHLSRLWIIVLRTTLIMVITIISVAGVAFQWYAESVSIVGQSGTATGRGIGLQEPIRITFSHPMDEARVTNGLTVTPRTPINMRWNAQSTELSIVPRTSWLSDTAYTIGVSATARSATFQPIEPWSMQFTTRAVLRVIQFLPATMSTNVPRESIAVVRFNQQMVPQSAIHVPVITPVLQITPPITHTQEWLDSTTVALRSNAYEPNQQYRITVPAETRDTAGRILGTDVSHTYTISADQVISVTPADWARDVGSTTAVVLTLTGSFDSAALRAAVRVEPTTEVTIEVQPRSTDTTQLTIRPVDRWTYATKYRVDIVALGPQQFTAQTHFETAPELTLVAQSPPNGQPLQAQRDLRFVFNAPLDATTITGAIHFSPEPVRPAQIETTGSDIRIRGVWASQSAPVLRIDTTLRSTAGNPLPSDIIQTFAIDPRASVLSLAGEPTHIVDISTTQNLRITMAPHTNATLTLTTLNPATYARVRALAPAEFVAYDPSRYGIRPFATIPLTTELDSAVNIDLAGILPATIESRVVLARIRDSKGSQDTRFIRILPATLHTLTLGTTLVAGVSPENDADPVTFEVFQNGSSITTGTADERGIWSTDAVTSGRTALIFSRGTPYDVAEHSIATLALPSPSITVMASQATAHAGADLPIACARSSATLPGAGTATLTTQPGRVLRARALVWNANQYIDTTTLKIPIDTPPGVATVSCTTETERSVSQLLILPDQTRTATLTRANTDQSSNIRIIDAGQRPIAGVFVYWRDADSYRGTRTDTSGRAEIPDTVATHALTLMTDQFRFVIPQSAERHLSIEPLAHWYEANVPFSIGVRLGHDGDTKPNASVELSIHSARGTVHQIRMMQTDDLGYATMQLELPLGTWRITARAGTSTARATAYVGVLPVTQTVQAQQQAFERNAPARWLTNVRDVQPLLYATLRDDGLQTSWIDGAPTGIYATEPITATTTILSAYATTTESYRSDATPIIDTACTTATVRAKWDVMLGLSVDLTAPPDSTISMALSDASGTLIGWRSDMRVPDDGVLTVPFSAPLPTSAFTIRSLIAHPWCQRIITNETLLPSTNDTQLDAPASVAIGDVIAVRYIIRDLLPDTDVTLSLDQTALLVVDPLPIYTRTTNADGTVDFRWNLRVLRSNPQLTISHHGARPTTWTPTVIPPLTSTSPDGFLLTGRTSLEAGRYDTPFDILRSMEDFATALDDDPPNANTPADVAHRIWLRQDRHDTSLLKRELIQSRRPDLTWGVDATADADPLITADVVIALAQMSYDNAFLQPMIPLLQRNADNTTVPLSVRAHTLYALSVVGERNLATMRALSALRDTLGNEGLAALILCAPQYPEIDFNVMRATLLARSVTASRGVQWASDPATIGIHSPAAQHMLIAAALLPANPSASVADAIRSYVLSQRGVAGWGDPIANARAWQIRSVLLPELDDTQRLTVTDGDGHVVSSGAIVHAQRVRGSTRISSDRPVLVGVEYPRGLIPPTQDVVLRQRYSTPEGQELAHIPVLAVGQSVDITTDIVCLLPRPYASLYIPIPALTTAAIRELPLDWSVQEVPGGYSIRMRTATTGVWKLRYRITAVRTGSARLDGLQVTDAAGTLHALAPTKTLYVTTP